MGKIKKFCPFFLVFMRAPANVPNLRFTKSIQPWYSQLVVENRCSGVVRSQSKSNNHNVFQLFVLRISMELPNKEFAEFVNNYACVKLCLF